MDNKIFHRSAAHHGFRPGYASLLRHNGVDVYSYEGEARPSHLIDGSTAFRMASVSKQFTGACIALLKAQRFLRYEDPLRKFFPQFNEAILLSHLLTHTSGIRDYEERVTATATQQVTDAEVVHMASKERGTYFVPGSAYRYSNTGFCILAQVVEVASGMSFPLFLNTFVFSPLGMSEAFVYARDVNNPFCALGYRRTEEGWQLYDQSLTSATQGDGCIYLSLNDYVKWIDAIARRSLFDLREELTLVNAPIERNLWYGMGWFNSGEELWHTGTTCGHSLAVWLKTGGRDARVYFSNSDQDYAPAAAMERQGPPQRFSFEKILGLTA